MSKIKQSYIVCSNIRTGSTLLCKTLEKLERYGKPEEYFHPLIIRDLKLNNNPQGFQDYYNTIVNEHSTDQGIFGIKLHWYQLQDLLKLARQCDDFREKKDLEIINILFPNPKFIYLWRKDIVAQSVSAVIAGQSGKWENLQSDKSKPKQNSTTKNVKFVPLKIYEWEQFLRLQNQLWENFLQQSNLPHYEITYEDLVDQFQQQINNILDFLAITTDEIDERQSLEMPTIRQSNQDNQKFIKYYQMLPKPLLKSGFQLKKIWRSFKK